MPIDSQLHAIEDQAAAGSLRSALATNKVIRNAYLLLAMTFAFSALTAAGRVIAQQVLR